MIIAVASGKGGTGKTTVTTSLAMVWDRPLVVADLDVDEPNVHLFLQPKILKTRVATLPIPIVDKDKCTRCGLCTDLCQFKAITIMGKLIMTFTEMCHGCGGCMAICPEQAIATGKRELGVIEHGLSQDRIVTLTGRLRIGEAMSPPLMASVRQAMHQEVAKNGADVLIDAPPGVSCPAMSAVADSDIIVLVTEPTPFGFYDFTLAWEAFSPLGKPMAVVINRAGLGDNRVYDFCKEKNLPVLAEIPYRRDIAEHYSRGLILSELDEALHTSFVALRDRLREINGGTYA